MADIFRNLVFVSFIILISCKSQVGKIELRKNVILQNQIFSDDISTEPIEEIKGSEKAYLINTSFTNSYQFTIREISVIDDTLTEYQTNRILLEPGDEKLIGETKFLLGKKFAESIIPDTVFSVGHLKKGNLYKYKNSTYTDIQVASAATKKGLSFVDYIKMYKIKNISLAKDTIKTLAKIEILDIKTKIIIDSTIKLKRKNVIKKYECTGELLISKSKKIN